MRIKLQQKLIHDGKQYLTGDELDMDDADAKDYIYMKMAVKVGGTYETAAMTAAAPAPRRGRPPKGGYETRDMRAE